MSLLKLDSHYLIPKSDFKICLIDNKTDKDIISIYSKRSDGPYYLDKFCKYIEKFHNISIIEYCEKFLNIKWPKCPSKNTNVGFRCRGGGLILSIYSRGGVNKSTCENFKKGCEKLSRDRVGNKNPMHGKKPWNLGKSYENPKMKGRRLSAEHVNKLKQARANSPIKARHTQKHSEETKRILKIRQAEKWKNGVFNRKTSIEFKVEEFLKEINLLDDFKFQEQIEYFTLDFGDKKRKIGIECQGTFFHVDPRFYPDGAIYPIQKRNLSRDTSKRNFFKKLKWTIIELWETEINNGSFKEILMSKLLELGVPEA
jgi:hypothetical protein